MKFKIIIANHLVLLFTLSGCVAVKPHMENSISRTNMSGNTGLLTGSFSHTIEGPHYHGYAIYFRDIENKLNKVILMKPSANLGLKFDDDFHNDQVAGSLFSYLLPAGKYEFYNFYIYRVTAAMTTTWNAEEDFSIPFEIKSGEITYIGEILWVPKTGENLFGMTIPDGADFYISNQKDRDIKLFKNRYKDLDWNSLVISVPAFEAN